MDEEMNVIVFAVAFDQFGLEVRTDLSKYSSKVANGGFRQDVTTVFCNKDQVHMEHVDDMPTGPIVHVVSPQTG